MKKLALASFFVFSTLVALAQPENPENPVPLDGGISLLVAAGAAYGGKKLYDKRKADKEENKAE